MHLGVRLGLDFGLVLDSLGLVCITVYTVYTNNTVTILSTYILSTLADVHGMLW